MVKYELVLIRDQLVKGKLLPPLLSISSTRSSGTTGSVTSGPNQSGSVQPGRGRTQQG